MADTILDGLGLGYTAGVDSDNRLMVSSVQEDKILEASQQGNFYFISCGVLTLTSDSASAVFSFSNNENRALVVTRIIFAAGIATNATNDLCVLASYMNPDGLSSSNGAMPIINGNMGSSNIIDITSELGEEAATVTGGTQGPAFYYKNANTSLFDTSVTLPKGTGLAFSVTPPTGNTSMPVSVALNTYLK